MESPLADEVYVSVDVEAAGPTPSLYALLSIGACLVSRPEERFYVELQPSLPASEPQAATVHQLSFDRLSAEGLPPADAMARFAGWLDTVVPTGDRPVFVAFNAAFDWMFVNDYFLRFLGHNPFGHAALDIKAYYMGLRRTRWSETSMRVLSPRYMDGRLLSHHALEDALAQAEMFRQLLVEANSILTSEGA